MMSYLAQAKAIEDYYLISRIKACAASQGVTNAHVWTMNHIWQLAAQPGWGDAYARVLDGEDTTDPAAWAGSAGADPDVITDAMILAGVQAILANETAE